VASTAKEGSAFAEKESEGNKNQKLEVRALKNGGATGDQWRAGKKLDQKKVKKKGDRGENEKERKKR